MRLLLQLKLMMMMMMMTSMLLRIKRRRSLCGHHLSVAISPPSVLI